MSVAPASRGMAILVVGMHRSGTSALTRVLNLLGADLGDKLLNSGRGNEKGHWENARALAIHETLLRELGTSWDDTRPLPAGWIDSTPARAAAVQIASLVDSEFGDSRLWALKDPRLCRLLPLWMEVLKRLGVPFRALFSVRHPDAVARSLGVRDDLDPASSRLSWMEHIAEPEAASRGVRREIVVYDDLLADWRPTMERVGDSLGIEWPRTVSDAASDVERFLTPADRHNLATPAASAKPMDVAVDLYMRCVACARGNGDWAAVSEAIDSYRRWSPLFLGDIERRGDAAKVVAAQLVDAEATTQAKVQKILDQSAVIQDHERKVFGLLETVQGKDVQIQNRDQLIRDKDAEIVRRDNLLHDKDAEIVRRDALLSEKDGQLRDTDRRIFGLLETVQGKDVQIQNRDQIIRDKDAEIGRSRKVIAEREAAIREGEKGIRELLDRLSGLVASVATADAQVREWADAGKRKDEQIHALAELLRTAQSRLAQLEQDQSTTRAQLVALMGQVSEREQAIAAMQATVSWRITRPLRGIRHLGSALARNRAVAAVVHQVNKLRHIGTTLRKTLGDPEMRARYLTLARVLGPRAAIHHTRAYLRRGGPRPRPPVPVPVFDIRPGLGRRAVILTTSHCDFVAQSIRRALQKIGVESSVIYAQPDGGYEDLPHFVICPQMFERLPGLYVAFQMEQSVSTRWFTDAYLRMLENSFAILDYSVANIEALVGKGLTRKQFFYLPLGYLPDYGAAPTGGDEDYDVVFYGDINNDRRRRFVAALEKVCRVKVIHDLFGEPLHAELAKAKLVVNIHYYEGALLETTRLWECVSLGKLVVSERAVNMDENGDLEDLVDFVDLNDVDGMVERVRYWLANESERRARLKANRNLAQRQANRFEYFFYRFLLAWDLISFHQFWQLAGSKLTLESDKLCLNLPEWFGRRRSFDQDNHYGFQVFPGLRHREGWIGCGLSYKLMIMLARKQRMPQITICEDDVEFRDGFAEDFSEIQTELATGNERWDVFSGLLGDLHADADVLKVRNLRSRKFVLTNRLISTVFNVYHRGVFDRVALWDDRDRDVVKNTIDRYLEHTRLSVLACYPFLVGHKEELHSTLWGIQNNAMAEMIQRSENLLGDKVEKFEAGVQQA